MARQMCGGRTHKSSPHKPSSFLTPQLLLGSLKAGGELENSWLYILNESAMKTLLLKSHLPRQKAAFLLAPLSLTAQVGQLPLNLSLEPATPHRLAPAQAGPRAPSSFALSMKRAPRTPPSHPVFLNPYRLDLQEVTQLVY